MGHTCFASEDHIWIVCSRQGLVCGHLRDLQTVDVGELCCLCFRCSGHASQLLQHRGPQRQSLFTAACRRATTFKMSLFCVSSKWSPADRQAITSDWCLPDRILLASSTLNRCAVELRTHDCASWPESQPVCLQRPCKDPCAIQLEMHW